MKEIFLVFLRLGLLGFGGPVATIAMMEDEATRKRRWLSQERFTEIYAVCKLLPGPVATQMAIYLGLIRGGIRGGLLSGTLFILPAFLLVLGLSYLYTASGVTQRFSFALLGMQAGALVVILASTYRLSLPYQKRLGAWILAFGSAWIVAASPGWEPLIILFSGMVGALYWTYGARLRNRTFSFIGIPIILTQLFWTCFKAGAFVFGTGLAVVRVLEGDAVQRFHWLTHSEFMDGLAIGQITPGPVVITSTFIGYKTAGLPGAFVATFGMFLPAFFNVLFLVPRIWKRFSGTPGAQGFSAWAIPAVIGGILGTSVHLGWMTLQTPFAIGMFTLSSWIAFQFRPPAWLLLILAGLLGSLAGPLCSIH